MSQIMGMRAVAATCLACALAAQAAPVSLVSGSGNWELSNGGGGEEQWYWGGLGGLVGAFNMANLKVVGVGEIHPAEQFWTNPDFGETYRTRIQVPTQVASVAFDSVTGQVTSVSNIGAVQLKGTRISGVLTGGTATISNLRFDLANQTVVADLAGLKSAVGTHPSVTYNMPDTTLWTFANVATGSEVIDSTSFASTLTFSGLRITSEGLDFLKSSLGLVFRNMTPPLSTGDYERKELISVDDYGSIQTRLVFSTAVPEPSTYALLGVGLVGLCVGRRRRAAVNESA